MLRKIVESPSVILREKSKKVEKFDKEFHSFLDDILETMYHEHGAGLSAIQVSVPLRVFTVDCGGSNKEPHFIVNPEFVYKSDEMMFEKEGCLSFPGGGVEIPRHKIVHIKYKDYDGVDKELEAEGYLAQAIQHEYDHLEGILLIDRVSKMKKDLLLRKVKKYQRLRDKNS